jgi:phosphoribosylanthranilate isomerase
MIKVKVCGIRDISNSREVADTGPDFMGFIFYPGSKRFVGDNPEFLLDKFHPNIRKVAVFVNENKDKVIEISKRYAFDLVQLHGNESVDYCHSLKLSGIKTIKAFGVSVRFDFQLLEPYLQSCDYFLFDTQTKSHGGSGIKFNWDELAGYKLEKPFFLSGGIGPEDSDAIRGFKHPALYAIDINSRFEVEPGVKDVNQVKAFIKNIKIVET